jgi:hypothetical protein
MSYWLIASGVASVMDAILCVGILQQRREINRLRQGVQ